MKIFSGLLINKFVSISIGSSGLAIIGQFRDFLGIFQNISSGGISQGIIKYTAEYKDDPVSMKELAHSGIRLAIAFTLLANLLVIFFYNFIKVNLFGSANTISIQLIFFSGISLFFISVNTFLISIITGLGNFRLVVALNLFSNVLGLIITLLLMYYFNLDGILYSLVIYQLVSFPITFVMLKKMKFSVGLVSVISGAANTTLTFRLLKYSLITIVTSLGMPASLVFVRSYVVGKLSWSDLGMWEGVWRISEYYLMFMGNALSLYLLPRLSALSGNVLKKEIYNSWKFVFPVSIISAFLIYLFRGLIVKILFGDKFVSMEDLFSFQLIGDIFKINAWILGNLMLAKAKVSEILISEISCSLLFVLFSILLFEQLGIKALTVAFLFSYIFYFAITLIFSRKYIF